jgi:signal transduction histidine kinase
MKLFTRYNRINLFATVAVFLLSGISFYFLLRFVLIDQVDEDLKIEQHEIETYESKYHQLPEIIQVRDQHTSYAAVNNDGGGRSFRTVKLKDEGERKKELFRRLTFYINTKGQWYEVEVSKSLEGTDDMTKSIVTITFITILLILIISFIVNRIVLRKLWQPFYDTLASMRHFELGKAKELHFPSTTIEEFTVMNDTLRHAMTKAGEDYQFLKEFTENASHELQTPLAIIRSKLDVLIQDEHLSEAQSKNVQGAYDAIQRLSRLNQGLLLLTKIENGQFTDTVSINLSQKIAEKILQFEEMIAVKNINLTTTMDETVHIQMNAALADIILNNLFSNAIKYNQPGGKINVIVNKTQFEISNSANADALEESRLFRRFAKSGQVQEGIGLGLAIIRQAAAYSGFQTNYAFKDQLHHFILIENNHS